MNFETPVGVLYNRGRSERTRSMPSDQVLVDRLLQGDANAFEVINELLGSSVDYHSPDLGPQLLAAKCRSHRMRVISWLVAAHGVVRDINGEPVVIESNLRDGLSHEEMYTIVVGARKALAKVFVDWDQIIESVRTRHQSGGLHLLARARHAKHPGVVFARAAATGEIDPLIDIESRLLVGLPVKSN